MTTEEKIQFKEMKTQIVELKRLIPAFDQSNLLDGYKSVTDTEIDVDITVGTEGGTFQVLDYPDELILIRYNGKIGRIPFYNETRF